MKFLIVSEGGDGIGLGIRLKQEGNEVRIWVRDSEAEKRGEGLLEHAKDNVWGEVIVADCTGSGALLDHMRGQGSRVVGGSAIADKLESDRTFANGVMKRVGIRTPSSKSFNDWESAIAFINDNKDGRFVFKPEGKLSGVVPSQVTKNNEELLESIEHFKTLVGANEPDFTLQEFIEGTAISTEGWFDGDKWLLPFNQTLERKHLMNDDIGPSGGCTGNLVWLTDYDNPVVVEGIAKMEDFLREHQYRGAIDLNTVVNEDGLFGLEFTPRFGYDALPTFMCGLYEGSFGSLLYEIAKGDAPEFLEVRDSYAVGVRLSVPPWPSEEFKAKEGLPILKLRDEHLEWFYPYDVEKKDGIFYTSGGYGITGVVNAFGDSIDGAFEEAYKRCKKLMFNDMQYRTDLCEVFKKDHRALTRLVA